MVLGNRPKLLAAAVGNITEGFGKFRNHDGNFTLCGELSDRGFLGHIVVRVVDFDRSLRTKALLPAAVPGPDPDPQTTYITFAGQKGEGPDQENRFSFAPDGQVRGMNVPTQLKKLWLDFVPQGPEGFRCAELKTAEVVGREIGFGRGSIAGASPVGTPFDPFLFEGVAHYSFFDKRGRTIGAITTNVLEGRRFDMSLPGVAGQNGLRFGFFGPIIQGSGCFRGAQGMFYGASGSIFNLPPGVHVVTHLYMARIHDPDGKYRAVISEARR
jgi:hypothetical protein